MCVTITKLYSKYPIAIFNSECWKALWISYGADLWYSWLFVWHCWSKSVASDGTSSRSSSQYFLFLYTNLFFIFSMAQCTNISCYSRNKHVWRGQQLITLNISAVIIFQRHLLNNHRHTSTASIWIEIVIYGKNNWCRMQNNNKDISYRHDTGGTPLCAKPLSQNHWIFKRTQCALQSSLTSILSNILVYIQKIRWKIILLIRVDFSIWHQLCFSNITVSIQIDVADVFLY